MRVFYNGTAEDMTLSVCPAGHLPAAECVREWFEEDGVTPRTFPVQFRGYEVIVPDPLGRYLIAEHIARSTKIIMSGQQNALVA